MKHPLFRNLVLLVLPLALTACSSSSSVVRLPAEPSQWQANPAGCVRVHSGNQIVLTPGRIFAENFRWSNSIIEFKVLDDPDTVFNITLYDDKFSEVRQKNARTWFDDSGKTLEEAGTLWRLDRVHALGVGGDSELLPPGHRAFGGSFTIRMGLRGLAEQTEVIMISENFKANQWNAIRMEIRDGLILVWVNGELGEYVHTDQRLNGTFGFEVWHGALRISDVKLTRL